MLRSLLMFLMTVTVWSTSPAAEIHVPADHATIASALGAALPGDTVTVASGVYHEHDLILKSNLVLRGATGSPIDVVIDGDSAGRVLGGITAIENVELQALTIRGGRASGGGGLFLQTIGDVTLLDCRFESNVSTSFGGGVFLQPILSVGAFTLERCVFENNSAISQGGGAAVWHALTVRDCVFSGNSSSNSTGGGLDQDDGDLLVRDSEFTGNSSRLSGGGLRADGGTIRIFGSTFRDNSIVSGSGGGASVQNGILGGCHFEGNSSGVHGGGLEASPLLQLNACDFVGNTAGSVAGGALVSGGTVTGCLFSANHANANGGGLQIHNATGSVADTVFENNTANTRGGAFTGIILGASYTFTNCTFSSNNAPTGSQGWIANNAVATLECCTADPSRWAEGSIIEDNGNCTVANDMIGFGDLKRQYR
jgi:predicted outer membrane repeat protein